MVTLVVLLMICALLLMAVAGVSTALVDPIIAILVVYGVYKLCRWVFRKKK